MSQTSQPGGVSPKNPSGGASQTNQPGGVSPKNPSGGASQKDPSRRKLPMRRNAPLLTFQFPEAHRGLPVRDYVVQYAVFDNGAAAEVFLTPAGKGAVGSELEAVCRDAAILASRLLQMGLDIGDLIASLTASPASLAAGAYSTPAAGGSLPLAAGACSSLTAGASLPLAAGACDTAATPIGLAMRLVRDDLGRAPVASRPGGV